MWICEQKIYNNGLVTADIYEADSIPSPHEESKSYDVYWDSFGTIGKAMECKEEALSENA
jgi:hypothetical protein